MAPPQFLVLGHIVKDIVPGGWRVGGGVAYAARQAQQLGLRVAAVTRCEASLRPETHLPGIAWRVGESDRTTSFENRYTDAGREQRVPATAPPVRLADVPLEWRKAPIVLFAPVLGDVEESLPAAFASSSLVGLGAQGWLRRCEDGRVLPGRIVATPPWLHGDVALISEEDATNPEDAALWLSRVPTVVLTRAGRGCTVWAGGRRHDLPAPAARDVDPTGAGDVFAAAMLVALSETRDVVEAARFAAAAASLTVGGAGLASVAGRDAIEKAMLAGKAGASR